MNKEQKREYIVTGSNERPLPAVLGRIITTIPPKKTITKEMEERKGRQASKNSDSDDSDDSEKLTMR